MDEMQRPIGVFDSGVGRISVLRELVALMPNEIYIYGDSKNAPYGTKTLEEVRKLTLADAEYLMTQNVKHWLSHATQRQAQRFTFKGKIPERDPGHRN